MINPSQLAFLLDLSQMNPSRNRLCITLNANNEFVIWYDYKTSTVILDIYLAKSFDGGGLFIDDLKQYIGCLVNSELIILGTNTYVT